MGLWACRLFPAWCAIAVLPRDIGGDLSSGPVVVVANLDDGTLGERSIECRQDGLDRVVEMNQVRGSGSVPRPHTVGVGHPVKTLELSIGSVKARESQDGPRDVRVLQPCRKRLFRFALDPAPRSSRPLLERLVDPAVVVPDRRGRGSVDDSAEPGLSTRRGDPSRTARIQRGAVLVGRGGETENGGLDFRQEGDQCRFARRDDVEGAQLDLDSRWIRSAPRSRPGRRDHRCAASGDGLGDLTAEPAGSYDGEFSRGAQTAST